MSFPCSTCGKHTLLKTTVLMSTIRLVATLAALLFSVTSATAQLVTNTTISPAQLVQNTLLGGGVTAFNIQYSGYSTAIGYFDGSGSNIGLNEGVILTTGTASDSIVFGQQAGPFGPNNASGSGIDNLTPGDPDLGTIGGATSFNATILEFDFIPTGDTIKFNYVFASEEYLEFVNAGVNDAFAFWISGPGIVGQQNIALVPGTTTPVTIDNVNNVTNPAYYIDNGDGMTAPQNTDPTVVGYDGFTTVLQAVAVVNPCDTFHIKIAISDIGDGILDSGVFLEAESFSSNNLIVSADIDFGSNDSTLYEGCGNATLTISRTNNFANVDTVFFTMGGNATNGADYNLIPDTMYFGVGVDTITLNLNAIADGIAEGVEQITMMAITNNVCSSDTSFITLYISDVPPLNLVMSNDTNVACGDSVPIWASASGGFGVLTYTWNTTLGVNDTSAFVSPGVTTTYVVTVQDTCNGNFITDSVTVIVPVFPPLSVNIGTATTLVCPGLSAPVFASGAGGAGSYTYQWDNGLGTDSINSVTPNTTTTYTVVMTDLCGNTATDSVTIVLDYDPIQVVASDDITMCSGDSTLLSATASNGVPNYTYSWSNGATTATDWVAPLGLQEYVITATDSCGQTATDTVLVVTTAPIAEFTHSANVYEENFPINFFDQSIGAVNSWSWDFGDENTSTDQNPNNIFVDDGDYLVMLAVQDTNGCVDTVWHTITIFPEFQFFAPNAFTPNGDLINDEFFGTGVGISDYRMRIWDRWGNLVKETEELFGTWDGKFGSQDAPIDVYVYEFYLVAFTGKEYTFRGHVTIVR